MIAVESLAGIAPRRHSTHPPELDALDAAAQLRLRLQRRAGHNLRRHVTRSLVRFTTLVAADLATFVFLRAVYRLVRDAAWLGATASAAVQTVLPAGYVYRWQYGAALFVGLFVTGNYGAGDRRRDVSRLLAGSALATGLVLWAAAWQRGLEVVALQYVVTTAGAWLALTVERLSLDALVGRIKARRPSAARTLLVGTREDCEGLRRQTALSDGMEFSLVGALDVARLGDLGGVIMEQDIETVLVCGLVDDEAFREIADRSIASGCQLLAVPRSVDLVGVQPQVVWRRGQPLIELTAPSLKGQQLVLKRICDLVAAAVAVVVLSPGLLVIALAIKLDSPGPVLFRQERVGAGGRRFNLFKFRTMKHGSSDAAHRELVSKMLGGDEGAAGTAIGNGKRVYKLLEDERVTRVGGWLRRTSLDELPQLLNVISGEMSLVGPRPPLGYECAAYDHWQFDRLQVKPGITGLWQVSGRSLMSYRQMCELDVEYVRRWSLWLDLKILLRTVPVVLLNSGRAV